MECSVRRLAVVVAISSCIYVIWLQRYNFFLNRERIPLKNIRLSQYVKERAN